MSEITDIFTGMGNAVDNFVEKVHSPKIAAKLLTQTTEKLSKLALNDII